MHNWNILKVDNQFWHTSLQRKGVWWNRGTCFPKSCPCCYCCTYIWNILKVIHPTTYFKAKKKSNVTAIKLASCLLGCRERPVVCIRIPMNCERSPHDGRKKILGSSVSTKHFLYVKPVIWEERIWKKQEKYESRLAIFLQMICIVMIITSFESTSIQSTLHHYMRGKKIPRICSNPIYYHVPKSLMKLSNKKYLRRFLFYLAFYCW